MTPELRQRAQDIEQLLRDILPEYQAAVRAEQRAEFIYRQAHAKATLEAPEDATVPAKKAHADRMVEDEMRKRNEARGNKEACAAAYYAYRDILQKVVAEIYAEREEMKLST